MAPMDKIHSKILRQFHTLCSLNGLTVDEKQAIVSSYEVDSSAEIDTHDLIDICAGLSRQLDGGKANEMDKLRKRCLRAICDWMKAKGIKATDNLAYAKQMACRSSQKLNFNRLTAAELRGVMGYFNNERKAMAGAATVAEEIAARLITQNFTGKPISVN
jgi:hypothetical protein